MTSKKQSELAIPIQNKKDAAYIVAKAGLSSIPLVGGAAVEIFQYLIQSPLEKRREQWMQDVGEKLQTLADGGGLDLEELQNNEIFISAVMQASHAALRTHQAQKILALKNAIVNVALGKGAEETTQDLLLRFIDELSEMHLRILAIFQSPSTPPGMSMGGLEHVLEYNIPELRNQKELYRQLWRDLYSRGLINTDGLGTTMTGHGLAERRTTALGDKLLQLISPN